MRDVSAPFGHPRDDGDLPTGPGGPDERPSSPRHMASGPSPVGRGPVGVGDRPAGGGEQRRDGSSPPHRRKVARTVLEWVAVVACGMVIAITAQAFLVQAFWIPSPSMTPTLAVGDRVLVNKLSYRTHDVHRGDVVVFERPPEASDGSDGEIKDLIKRVVAVGGDTIEGRDGAVYVNGERIEEPYLAPGTPTDNLEREVVPEGEIFVMGDNRTNSEDSRVFGPIPDDTVVGRAVVKVLPPDDVGWL